MPRQEHFELSGFIRRQTEKAIEFSDDGDEWTWLPKSQIEFERDASGGTYTITAPEWLLREKGLI